MDFGDTRPPKAAATSSEKQGTSTATGDKDYISRLPDELLCRILSNIGLRDAVKTSVLSHRWRYLSASEPSLDVNWDDMFLSDSNYESWENCKNPCIIYEEKFVKAVSQFLQFHQCTRIQVFKLEYCLDGRCEHYIDKWVKFALLKGVENLSLSFQCCKNCLKSTEDGEYYFDYVFKSELFDRIETKLRHLDLTSCILESNFTYQFSLLNSISFCRVHLPLDDLENMFSFMVNLKTLDITKCILPEKLSLGSLTLLQKILVYRSYGLEKLELSNPHLTKLKCYCSSEIKCNLSGAPKLENLSYAVSADEFDRIFTDLPEQNPHLGTLTVVSLDDWFDWAPPHNIRMLSQVTSLDLHFLLPTEFSLVKIMAILKAFPHLRFFCLMMTCPMDLEGEELHQITYVPQYLTQIVIAQFHYTPLQIEFVIHLLKNASALEKMSIAITSDSLPLGVSEEEGQHLITETLQEFDKGNILDVQMFVGIPLG